MAHDILKLSAVEVSKLFKAGELSAREITQIHLDHIAETEPKINAFTELCPEIAYSAADALDAKRAAGEELGPLAGAPIGIKDNMQVVGTKMTCSAKMLENYQSVYDCTAARRALDAGMILLGKLNLDEFAFGASTETSIFGPTHNPWNLDCVPGGSSGGSAAALASNMVSVALGSDTGGSIRQPAAFTGTVGMKPTYGRVSRYGCASFASSLDQVGPMTKTVADNALLLNAIAGKDPRDSTSAPVAEDFSLALGADLKGFRVGIASELMQFAQLNPEIRAAVIAAGEVLAALGAEVDDIALPHAEFSLAAYSIIAPAEASSNFARLDGMRYGFRSEEASDVHDLYLKSRGEGFGDEVKRRNIFGTYMLSTGQNETYRIQAQRVRRMIGEEFKSVFATHDLILTPTSLDTAFKIGDKAKSAVEMYLSDVYTIPTNLAGNVGLSIPAGLSSAGMPIGIQLIADHFQESKAYAAASALEKHFGRLILG